MIRHLRANPRLQRDRLISTDKFNFGDHQSLGSRKHVNFPDDAFMPDTIPRLLRERPATQPLEHFLGVIDRNLVFELRARRTNFPPLTVM